MGSCRHGRRDRVGLMRVSKSLPSGAGAGDAEHRAREPGGNDMTEAVHASPEILRAAQQAVLAPSVHNTQPWRLHADEHTLDLFIDPERQLRVLDPRGRQMMISAGCALMNIRV